jgi:Ni,Fe-hydrogenase III small subunit
MVGAMTIRSILRAIVHPRTVTEELSPPSPDTAGTPGLAGSLQIRHVDAGSCNGCELEIASAFGPVYDLERFGVRLVASPRHADALLVTGPVTKNMVGPLMKSFDALPEPRIVIALGDCAANCGVFQGGYGVEGSVDDVLPVDVRIAGCPPDPDAIIRALRGITGR